MRNAGIAALALLAFGLMPDLASAGETAYCVTCSDPQKTYLCQVTTPGSSPSKKALQLYCTMRTAKDGKHRSCAASRTPTTQCRGTIRRYTLNLGDDLPGVRSAVRQYRGKTPVAKAPEPPTPPEKPKTLFGITSKGVKKTGSLVGDAARGAKRRVGNAGTAIGDAARSAFDCMKKLFRKCGKDESEEPVAENQPVPLTPEKARPQ